MKKRKILDRLLAGILAALLITLSLPLSLLASAEETQAPRSTPTELDALSEYVDIGESVVQADTYGNLVTLHFYYDRARTYTASTTGYNGSTMILYLMNTGIERIGQDTDENIVRGMLQRGYYVIVADYCGIDIVSPDFDYSVQSIGQKIADGVLKTPSKPSDSQRITSIIYPVPAGYDIAYGIPYFSYDKHGAAGTLECIVEIWNNDFRSVKRNYIVKWVDEDGNRKTTKPIEDGYDVWYSDAEGKTVDQENGQYTKIGNTWATTLTDCVRPDGSFIDLDLCMDVIYPTTVEGGAELEVPLMVALNSSYTRSNMWLIDHRPQPVGFLSAGYALVISSYGLVPMCRNDHYGYFSGTNLGGSVSGDNYTYSLTVYNGVKSDTALIRMLRTLAVDGLTVTTDYDQNTIENFKIPIDIDAIGAYGNSKAGLVTKLANPHPELLEDLRHFDGHVGETRYDAMTDATYGYDDPYLDTNGETAATIDARIRLPEDTQFVTYADGTAISSQANMVYAQCGGCWETITEGGSPLFAAGTQKPGGDGCSYWNFYRTILNMSRTADTPFYGLVCPDVGHDFGYGEDKDYGIDTYYAFHRYANYWLHGADPTCEIIDVDAKNDIGIAVDDGVDYIYEIEEGSAIRLQFIGQIGGEEIGKVEIVNALTGEPLTGQWTSVFGGQQWKFLPTNIEENTYYRITVPTTIRDQKGRSLAEEKALLFRTASGSAADAVTTETAENGDTYFVFAAGEYDTSYKTTLRFTVEDADAANTLTVFAAPLSDGQSASDVTDWESLGEVVIIGADTYTFDVTEYMKDQTGRVAFRLSAKYEAGTSRKEYGVDETTKVNSLSYGAIGWTAVAEVEETPEEAASGTEKDHLLRIDGFTRTSSWIDLNNDLCGNYINNISTALRIDTGISQGKLTEADLGRTFRISFRVYDTTSRNLVVLMRADEGNGAYDFDNMEKSYTTKANDWTTIEFEFTVDSLEACSKYDCRQLYIYTENKSSVSVDKYAAPACNQMALASNGDKPSGYAGERGLTDKYTTYSNAYAAMQDGKVTVNQNHNDPLYIESVSFTEVHTSVTPRAVKLVAVPLSEKTLGSVGGVTLDSSDPTGSDSTTLTVSGGSQSADTASKKVYLKLSLADYTAEDPAYFSFTASGDANMIAAYGVKDAAAGASWDPATVTPSTAPANDADGSGVKLSEVWNGDALATVYVKNGKTTTLDITEYATECKKAGCDTLTLILIAASAGGTVVGTQDFTTMKSTDLMNYTTTTGHDANTVQKILTENGNPSYVLKTAHENDAMHLSGLFETKSSGLVEGDHKLWTEEDVGKTYRITFKAKTGGEENNTITHLKAGMMSGINRYAYGTTDTSWTVAEGETGDSPVHGWYMYQESEQMAVKDVWQTYTYTFTVDATMLPKLCLYQGGVSKKQQAISYFGVTAIASNYSSGDNTLYIDDIVVEEVYGETTVTPVETTGIKSVSVQDFSAITTATLPNYTTTTGHKNTDTLKTTQAIEKDTDGNSYYVLNSKQAEEKMHLALVFDEKQLSDGSTHMQWTEADIGRTFRITFRAKISDDATNKITQIQFGMLSGVNRENNRSSWCHITNPEDADGPSDKSEAYDSQRKNYGWNLYQKSAAFDIDTEWQTYTYTFTVDSTMLPKNCTYYPGTTSQKIKPEAISYFGVGPIATNFGADYANELCIDDIAVEEIENYISAQDFSAITTATLPNYTTTTGQKVQAPASKQTIEKDTDGNSYYVLNSKQAEEKMHLALIFDKKQLSDGSTHMQWTEADIGRTFRITFRAKKSSADNNAITQIQFGMLSGVNRENNGSTWVNITNAAEADGKSYGWNLYQKSAVFSINTEWQTYTYTFTVDSTMLPKNCTYYPGTTSQETKPEAISYFGVGPYGLDNTKECGEDSANELCIDDILVQESVNAPGATVGMQDFSSISLGSSTMTTGLNGNAKQTIETDENGNSYYQLKTVHANEALHLSGLFGTTAGSNHYLWTEEDIGRTFRVTFRAKTGGEANNGITHLRIGMMSGVNREVNSGSSWCYITDPKQADGKYYGWYPYQKTGNLAVSSEWKTYTYVFTVDETMLPKQCSYSDGETAMQAISYLGICPIVPELEATGDVADAATTSHTLCVDDIRVREVNDFAGSTLSAVSELSLNKTANSEKLGIYAQPTAYGNVKYAVLPFDTETAENVKQLTLSFDLTGTNAETAKLYLLAGKLPSSLTWETVSPYLNDPVATFTVKDGKNTVDVTEQLSSLLGQKVLFVLTVEEEGGVIGVSTPTLTIGSATAEDFDADGFKVRSNLTLASDLRYNLYIPKLDVVKEITLDGAAQKLYDLPTREESGVTYYVVTKALAAKNAADTVTAEVLIDTGAKRMTATYAFSIPAYAKQIVNGSYDEKTQTLMKDMLAYIDAAMTYFGTATTEKQTAITDVIGTEYAIPTDATVGLAKEDIAFEKEGDAVESAALLLEDTPAFVFYLKEGKEDLADTFSFTSAEGAPLKVEKRREGGRTLLVVTTYAYGMNDTLTFTYTGGSGSYNLAKYHSGTTDENLAKLTVRLAKYANSAKDYKAAAESA